VDQPVGRLGVGRRRLGPLGGAAAAPLASLGQTLLMAGMPANGAPT
jgi:hypothetical protein